MKRQDFRCCLIRALIVFAAVWGFGSAGILNPGDLWAEDAQEAAQLVEKARYTFQNFTADKEAQPFRDLVKKARGIYICPQMLRGAFVIGASGGTGVFVAREPQTDTWLGPAFYTVGEVSFGLQAGAEASEIILLAMTERGANALLNSSVKLGADVTVALGPVGAGADASTANFSADILTFARSKGLYGGVSLKGAVVKIREGLNTAYYGKPATPADILVRKNVKNPQARELLLTVAKYAGGTGGK
ncbi:MAG TPA: lipid-binding SYLF domain-containing protein [Syntrophales bacterium]|jgi:lipid-binding SYLF domain-containing protein|nr:lipid-binding SYLF domain-containing protein [Syntrophales bacterium]HON23532.1 lipid-binding SYLF domain-containing protein [Syntrophales bacterium]HOU77319.1 lipid-binding SYLF domain-containing protein [Syntrophales bacterium]HPC32678.1 lipid-binding SYLF domain-containing protein [Syntrophales bacterium]HQG33992.1 lipid-binding SYLF domain-containing protein [Syntrophales bacterium]